MNCGAGWRVFDCGRRIERGVNTCRFARHFASGRRAGRRSRRLARSRRSRRSPIVRAISWASLSIRFATWSCSICSIRARLPFRSSGSTNILNSALAQRRWNARGAAPPDFTACGRIATATASSSRQRKDSRFQREPSSSADAIAVRYFFKVRMSPGPTNRAASRDLRYPPSDTLRIWLDRDVLTLRAAASADDGAGQRVLSSELSLPPRLRKRIERICFFRQPPHFSHHRNRASQTHRRGQYKRRDRPDASRAINVELRRSKRCGRTPLLFSPLTRTRPPISCIRAALSALPTGVRLCARSFPARRADPRRRQGIDAADQGRFQI